MPIYDYFADDLFREFGSSTRENLDDIGLDYEEQDKITFEVDKENGPVSLRVDFSDFANHIFFGSAYSAINFALIRLFDPENGYPIDGELKSKNEWMRVNSGFENWFFDNYPKQHGHAFFVSSSNKTFIELKDFQNKLNPHSSSITLELVIKSHEDIPTEGYTLLSYNDAAVANGFDISLSSSKELVFSVYSASVSSNVKIAFDPYISSSHHISCQYNQLAQSQSIFVDGNLRASSSIGTPLDFIFNNLQRFYVGILSQSTGIRSVYSGSIGDVRCWLSNRSPDLIKRNYYKTTHANASGALKLYYKFSELIDTQPTASVFDYSGNELHGVFGINFTSSLNKVSGTIGSWFKDSQEPIFNLVNSRVDSFISDLRVSGSAFDKSNINYIFKLIPSQFIEEDGHEELQNFLLLIARHYDKLKLYIQTLGQSLYSNSEDFGGAPDELINVVAKNYGLDLGGIYEESNPLQYFFGETVLSSGSLDQSIQLIRNQLRRNLLNNLIYIIKTKSTKESIKSSLRSLGLDDSVININEYSIFSGGIQTTFTPKTVECKVARLTSSANLYLDTVSYSATEDRMYQIRTLFNTASINTTSSILTIQTGSIPIFYVHAERENLTSSQGRIRFSYPGATPAFLTTSLFNAFNNEWININFANEISKNQYWLFVTKLDRDSLEITGTLHSGTTSATIRPSLTNLTASIGTSGSNYFDGFAQEIRTWNKTFSASTLQLQGHDFNSLAVPNFLTDLPRLLLHNKLNDFTGSLTGTGSLHNFVNGTNNSTYRGFSSSAEFNFPGKYLEKAEQSYSYDIAINNDKVRLRDSTTLSKLDIIKDIPFVSIDVSPVASLNKEIAKWFGTLDKFNNIIGYPYLKYYSEIPDLNLYKHKYFSTKVNSKLDYSNYLNLIKWFDANFTYFLGQLIPLDMTAILSSFVIEPHLLEYNKVEYKFPYKQDNKQTIIDVSSSLTPTMTASSIGHDIALADPGRFGSVVSSSGLLSNDLVFDYSRTGSDLGVNFQRPIERKVLDTFMSGNRGNFAPQGYGNGFHFTVITGANYLKNTYNINPDFSIALIHYRGDSVVSDYLSSSQGAPTNTHYTGTFNGVFDQRWLWATSFNGQNFPVGVPYDLGIGYGGGWGQLWYVNNKSQKTSMINGLNADVRLATITPIVEYAEVSENSKTFVFWPNIYAWDGVSLNRFPASLTASIKGGNRAMSFGDVIPIEGFKSATFKINVSVFDPSATSASRLAIHLRFQFFNGDLPGDKIYESILSSSHEASGYITSKVPHLVILDSGQLPQNEPQDYSFDYERELPNAKFMRVHVTAILPNFANDDSSYQTTYKVTLTNEVSDFQKDLPIRTV